MDYVLGIDEVGRGALAGPVVAGAVVLGPKFPAKISNRLKDSKLLTRLTRQNLQTEICRYAADFSLGWSSAEEVDNLGLTEAVRLAMQRAVENIREQYNEIIIDGNYNFLANDTRSQAVIKADLTVPAVSAASIIAKVARDAYMSKLCSKYPNYGFSDHVGYGTARHRQAIIRHGFCPHHRLSFKPPKALL